MKALEGTIAAVARNTCVGSQHCHLSWIQTLLLPQAGAEDMDLGAGEEFVPFPDTEAMWKSVICAAADCGAQGSFSCSGADGCRLTAENES
ncbi:hypothetical protein LEMLEM_LOCUS5745 [Lemmus lemmus]